MDKTDEYIIAHSRSMSQQEIADKLGINKSTVSRRMASLRESGEINAKVKTTASSESQQARERAKDCTLSRVDRLKALTELKDMLHADLALAGGQGLARISSEYRQTLEQLEALSTDLELIDSTARKLGMIQYTKLKIAVTSDFPSVEHDTAVDIVDTVIRYLADIDLIAAPTTLDEILSTAEAASADE